MSLLWCDQLRLVLYPDKVIAVRLGRGLYPAVKEKMIWECSQVVGKPWQAPLQLLAEKMPEIEAMKAQVVVIVSHHFMRYAVLPWSDQVRGREEVRMLARIYFDKLVGNLSATWAIHPSAERFGLPRIASALDQEFLDGLTALFANGRARLVSVQPSLMAAVNQWRTSLGAHASACLVLEESGKVCIAITNGHRWQTVRIHNIGENLEETLPPLLEREFMLCGCVPDKLFIHIPKATTRLSASKHRFNAELLRLPERSGFDPYLDAAFDVALNGVS